jgi:hypothetical protein
LGSDAKQNVMNYNVIAYLVYMPVTLGLSIWIAKTLHKNSKVFLIDAFKGRDLAATATNNLLQTGFYLLAFGTSFIKMRIRENPRWENNVMVYDYLGTPQQTIEELAIKLGSFTLILGLLLFLNFFIMLMLPKPKVQQIQNINE